MFPHKGSPHQLGTVLGAKYGWGRDHTWVKGSPSPHTHTGLSRAVMGVTGLGANAGGDNPLLLGARGMPALN